MTTEMRTDTGRRCSRTSTVKLRPDGCSSGPVGTTKDCVTESRCFPNTSRQHFSRLLHVHVPPCSLEAINDQDMKSMKIHFPHALPHGQPGLVVWLSRWECLLPPPFDLARFRYVRSISVGRPEHPPYPTNTLTSNQDSLSCCLGGRIRWPAAPLSRYAAPHFSSYRLSGLPSECSSSAAAL
jgi:hypothetical protein